MSQNFTVIESKMRVLGQKTTGTDFLRLKCKNLLTFDLASQTHLYFCCSIMHVHCRTILLLQSNACTL